MEKTPALNPRYFPLFPLYDKAFQLVSSCKQFFGWFEVRYSGIKYSDYIFRIFSWKIWIQTEQAVNILTNLIDDSYIIIFPEFLFWKISIPKFDPEVKENGKIFSEELKKLTPLVFHYPVQLLTQFLDTIWLAITPAAGILYFLQWECTYEICEKKFI